MFLVGVWLHSLKCSEKHSSVWRDIKWKNKKNLFSQPSPLLAKTHLIHQQKPSRLKRTWLVGLNLSQVGLNTKKPILKLPSTLVVIAPHSTTSMTTIDCKLYVNYQAFTSPRNIDYEALDWGPVQLHLAIAPCNSPKSFTIFFLNFFTFLHFLYLMVEIWSCFLQF